MLVKDVEMSSSGIELLQWAVNFVVDEVNVVQVS